MANKLNHLNSRPKPGLANSSAGQKPPRKKRSAKRTARNEFPVPLTVLADLLGRHKSTPYKAAKTFGLARWVRAQLRDQLSRGTWFSKALDLPRAIRFNEKDLLIRSTYVLSRRFSHMGRVLDGAGLCEALEIPAHLRHADFIDAWCAFVRWMANRLIEAADHGHIEDVQWRVAERFLDQQVVPGVRRIRTFDPMADEILPFARGGARRMQRLVERITSKVPEIREQATASWEMRRMFNKNAPDPQGLDEELAGLDLMAFK